MNIRQLLAVAALGGLLVLPATAAAFNRSAGFQAAGPARIVSPTELPRSYRGTMVLLRLTVDASGRPHDIQVVGERDATLVRRLTLAVAQWEFTPARQDGIAIDSRIELPLQLVED